MTDRTVLVVEDEEDIRDSLQEVFADEGYHVLLASNGREALERLRQIRPCAIILDVIMPVMSGTEFYAALRADPTLADIPVIVSTSDPARAPSGVVIMKKPIDLGRLIETVATLCPRGLSA